MIERWTAMSNYQNIEEISKVIRKRKNKAAIKTGYIHLLLRIALLGILGYLLLSQVFLITRAEGNDMYPAMKDGDLMIGFRLQAEYQKNDVIIYRMDGKDRTGRLIAQENDVVIMDETGALLVNGSVQGGEIHYPSYAKAGITYPYRVPESQMFIMGDHRTQAADSRDFGSVAEEQVLGKVITILRRRGL